MKKVLILLLAVLLVTGCGDININYNSNTDNNLIKKEDKKDTVTNDQELVEYIEEVEKEVDNEKDKNTLKNTFVTLTDFIFYDGEIKGKKFSELKDESKEKIMKAYENIDSKINSKYPDYKNEIKENGKKTYSNAKEKLNELKE